MRSAFAASALTAILLATGPAIAQFPNLSGGYVGLDLGYGSFGGDTKTTVANPAPGFPTTIDASLNQNGPYLGGFGGYRLRVAERFYVALEAGGDYAFGSKPALSIVGSNGVQQTSVQRTWALRLDLRPSWQAWGGTQLYGIAGLSYVNFDTNGLSGDSDVFGFRIGAGAEVNLNTA